MGHTRYRLRLSLPMLGSVILPAEASVRASSCVNARSTSTGLPLTVMCGPCPALHKAPSLFQPAPFGAFNSTAALAQICGRSERM